MATKLLCPQCRVELPAGFEPGAAGRCPRCRVTFAAPRSSRRSAVVLTAQPFQTTFDPEPRRSGRWIYWLAAVVALVSVGGVFWMTRPGAPTETGTPTVATLPVASPSANATVKKPTAPAPILDPVDDLIPKRPPLKVRVVNPTLPAPSFVVKTPQTMPSTVDPAKVDAAIQKGIEYLKSNEHRWINVDSNAVGYAALPGLALLEVGVPAAEPAIARAAALVRSQSPKLRNTYEMSLAILFLDRLGDPGDRPLIRSLGLRLLAGQTSQWGWDYNVPSLPPDLETPLETALKRLEPESPWRSPLAREPGKGLVDLPRPLREGAPPREGNVPREGGLPRGESPPRISGDPKSADPKTSAPKMIMPLVLGDPERVKEVVKELPSSLRLIPSLQIPGDETDLPVRTKGKGKGAGRDDNSNTQFALLALWAARRHGVPVDRSLLLADKRFAQSQTGDGSWGYHVWDQRGRPAMTCVGLLGLALGHGTLLPAEQDADAIRPPADPAIARGLQALSRWIGRGDDREDDGDRDLYLLWSVERVGMLYQLPEIGGKDWYAWGAGQLFRTQRPDGSWPASDYPGSATPLDTAFALLFLNRSNLVPDLTERLQLHMTIQDKK